MVGKLIVLIMLLLTRTNLKEEYTYVGKEISIFRKEEIKKEIKKEKNEEKTIPVIATYHGNITAYGPDCAGCIGITASGYNVKNNIYYKDKEYGKVRIVAADKSLPFGSIVRISGNKAFSDPILAIVLDRGSAIGFSKNVYFDLLYQSERDTNSFGKRKATFEILRRGY